MPVIIQLATFSFPPMNSKDYSVICLPYIAACNVTCHSEGITQFEILDNILLKIMCENAVHWDLTPHVTYGLPYDCQ
jgi:hypothetical protein